MAFLGLGDVGDNRLLKSIIDHRNRRRSAIDNRLSAIIATSLTDIQEISYISDADVQTSHTSGTLETQTPHASDTIDTHMDDSTVTNTTLNDTNVSQTSNSSVEKDELVFIRQKFRNPVENGLNGKFLDFDQTLLTLLKASPGQNLKTIPNGQKENVFFLIDHEHDQTAKRTFIDDCGAWMRPSLKTHYYLCHQNGTFDYIYKKQELFYTKKTHCIYCTY